MVRRDYKRKDTDGLESVEKMSRGEEWTEHKVFNEITEVYLLCAVLLR